MNQDLKSLLNFHIHIWNYSWYVYSIVITLYNYVFQSSVSKSPARRILREHDFNTPKSTVKGRSIKDLSPIYHDSTFSVDNKVIMIFILRLIVFYMFY